MVHAQHSTESLACSNGHASWIPRWDVALEDVPNAFWGRWDASLRARRQYTSRVRILGDKLSASALMFNTVGCQTDVMRGSDLDLYNGKIGSWIEDCWTLTKRAARLVPHAHLENSVVAFASILRCSCEPKVADEYNCRQLIGDFSQACAIFNHRSYKEEIFPLGLEYVWGGALRHETFARHFQHYGSNRRFFVTKHGYWGLGPAAMRETDVCTVLLGADVPFVLRPTPKTRTFQLVGQAYVYEVMDGELIRKTEGEAGFSAEDICIV